MLSQVIEFIQNTCILFNIDDSHGLGHAIKTLLWSLRISKDMKLTFYESKVIQLSCLLHDMCDKKYMDEQFGVNRIRIFLSETWPAHGFNIAPTRQGPRNKSVGSFRRGAPRDNTPPPGAGPPVPGAASSLRPRTTCSALSPYPRKPPWAPAARF